MESTNSIANCVRTRRTTTVVCDGSLLIFEPRADQHQGIKVKVAKLKHRYLERSYLLLGELRGDRASGPQALQSLDGGVDHVLHVLHLVQGTSVPRLGRILAVRHPSPCANNRRLLQQVTGPLLFDGHNAVPHWDSLITGPPSNQTTYQH